MLGHMDWELNPHLIFSQGKFIKFFDYRTILCLVFLLELRVG